MTHNVGVMRSHPAKTLRTAALAHLIHDGFAEMLYVLLPLWTQAFGLSLAQAGLLKSMHGVGMAGFQVPAGLCAERIGERRVLVAGTLLSAIGFIAAGFSGGFSALLGCLAAAGLGSAVQHPLSSSLVSKAYESGGRRMALGTYNFSGDIGKILIPAATAFAIPWMGWRGVTAGYGLIGLAAAVVVLVALVRLGAGEALPRDDVDGQPPAGTATWGIRDGRGFGALAGIQIIDSGTRTALLTFLPFLLLSKGASLQTVGLALMLLFLGGATGKFLCGVMAERLGVIRTVVVTESATGLGIVLMLTLPLAGILALLPPLGVALNGTSSVLYGTVADFVDVSRRSRGYALFYTFGLGASAAAPVAFGALADLNGVPFTLSVVGLGVFLTLPLALALQRPLERVTA
jgi:FSR family fosmidomycin resistance protein-like MFS transporter